MTYKALFLDVDGTTVLHGIDSLPTVRVTQKIKEAMDCGIMVGLATSRPPRSAVGVIEHLRLNGYCVLSSGSEIYDSKNREVIIRKEFPINAIPHILKAAQMHHASVHIYDGKEEFVFKGGTVPKHVLGMYFPEIEATVLQNLTKELSLVEGISLHRMEAWNTKYECLDIVRSDSSKLHGVIEVLRLLGITMHDVIGIGDGYNDFPLLLACGLKIAMGNAVPELKAIADFVAPSVEEDGVAVVIEKFLLS